MTTRNKQILAAIVAALIVAVALAYSRDPGARHKAFREGFDSTAGSAKP